MQMLTHTPNACTRLLIVPNLNGTASGGAEGDFIWTTLKPILYIGLAAWIELVYLTENVSTVYILKCFVVAM